MQPREWAAVTRPRWRGAVEGLAMEWVQRGLAIRLEIRELV